MPKIILIYFYWGVPPLRSVAYRLQPRAKPWGRKASTSRFCRRANGFRPAGFPPKRSRNQPARAKHKIDSEK